MSTPIPALGNKTPEQLKVTELREELKKRGLNLKGLKKDLVERLDEVLREELARQQAEALAEAEASRDVEKDTSDDEVNVPPPARSEEVAPVDVVAEEVVSETGPPQSPPQSAPASVVEEEKDATEPGPVQVAAPSVPLPISKSVEEDLVTNHVPKDASIKLNVDLASDPDDSGDDFPPEVESAVVPETSAPPKAEEVVGEWTSPRSPRQDVAEHVSENCPQTAKVVDEPINAAAVVSEEEATGKPQVVVQDDREVEVDLEKAAEQDTKLCQEVDQPHRSPSPVARQAASTEAVILGASDGEVEPDALPRENAPFSEVLDGEVDGRLVVKEEAYAEASGVVVMETTVTETITVTTETTVEEVVYSEVDAEVSRARDDHDVGSPTERNSDAGTRSLETKERPETAIEEAMDAEYGATTKESKPMEIDSESLAGSKRKDGDDLRQQEPAKRQRRWNSEKSAGAGADVKSPPKALTTDTVKEIVPADSREAGVHASVAAAGSPSTILSSAPKTSAPTNVEKLAVSRPHPARIDASVNGEAEKKRHIPPPLRSPTNSLKIDRFVRPFTIKAVRELLEQTGTVKDMWMDQIKTHCFVTYSAEEEAIATRNALYNLQWPVAGGRLLVAEFVEPDEVKLRVDGLADKSAVTPVTTPRGSGSSAVPGAAPIGLMALSGPPSTSGLPPPPPLPPPPRERPTLPSKKELEPPIPTLDDLFKKTWTKPQIYYLPLTDEQVAAKARNKASGNKSSVKA